MIFIFIVMVFFTYFIAHEIGKSSLCNDLGGDFSYDFSKCVSDIEQVVIK